MRMDVEGTFTIEDLKYMLGISLWPLQRLYVPGLLLAPVALVFLVWLQGQPLLPLVYLIPPIEAFLLLLVFWIGPRISLQKLRRRGLLDALRRVRITDDTYVIETKTVRTEFKWESFKRFHETDGGFCFYFKNPTFEYLPKHWLTAEQVEELRTFLPRAIA
jgi:YcxB-like protein